MDTITVARIEAATHVEAAPQRVWDVLVDWERQPRWMHDARSVRVTSDHRRGVGVVVVCATDIAAGIVVDDPMTITAWEEPRLLGVRHLGAIIRGVGAFELSATEAGTAVTWWEDVTVPFGALGEAVARLTVVPLVQRVFRISLANLKRLAESSSVRP